MRVLKALSKLVKAASTFFIAASALAAFLAAKPLKPQEGVPLFFGVFLLAAGCSALNQFQEKDIDRTMERTRLRPLITGIISPGAALAISPALIFSGFSIFMASHWFVTAILGFSGFVWYNLLYTPLKSRSGLAIFPGALAGCLPLLMGWICGNGEISDPRLWAVLAFAYCWQIVHFGLLLLSHNRDYNESSIPNLLKCFGEKGVTTLTLAGMVICLPLVWLGARQCKEGFPGSIAAWFCWLQPLIIIGFAWVVRNGFRSFFPPFFHIWNSWLGIGIFLIIFHLVSF